MAGTGCQAWVAALLTAVLIFPLATQANTDTPHNLRFEQLNVDQGLAQETVTSIVQDRRGFMWFGSQNGLSRFDGYRVRVFRNDPTEPGSLADNWVSAVHEDGSGRLWVGTRGGVQGWRPETGGFERFTVQDPLLESGGKAQVRALLSESYPAGVNAGVRETLWIATDRGLQRLDIQQRTLEAWRHRADAPDSLANDDVKALARDRQGRLWIGTADGLDMLQPGVPGIKHFRLDQSAENAPRHNVIHALRVDRSNTLWIGTQFGLEAWDLDKEPFHRRRFSEQHGLQDGLVRAILEDQAGTIWIGCENAGLKHWDAASERFAGYRHSIADRNSLADDDVAALYQDRGGTLWVGTWTAGASRADLTSGGFDRYVDFANGPVSRNDNKVYAIAGDRDGTLLLGTVGGGLHRLDRVGKQTTSYRHDPSDPSSLPDDIVRAVHVDMRDRIWIGTASGLARLDAASGKFWSSRLGGGNPALDGIRSITGSAGGALWIGTEGGLLRYSPDTDSVERFVHDPQSDRGPSQGRVLALLEDSRGTLWVGTESGLDRLHAGSQEFVHSRHDPGRSNGLSHNRVHDLFQDRAGRIWVGTASGLNRIDHPEASALSFRAYGHRHGLGDDPIGAAREDAQGQIWVSTNDGISRLDPDSGEIHAYSTRDGLLSGAYYIGSGYADGEGRLYFGGFNGLTAFKPELIRENTIVPEVVITELQLFNRPVTSSDRPSGVELAGAIEDATALQLSHAHSVFSLEFAALHFSNPNANRYAYQLEGFDPDWIETDATRRFVTYTNLDPEAYVFRVKAANKDGIWNQTGAALAITITPPFWATWWFRLAAAVLILGAIRLLYQYRIAGLTRQRRQLEQQVAIRTAEVSTQKEDIEKAHRNLSVLSEVGREITAVLDERALFAALDRHVHDLLDATVFGIYVLVGEELVSATLVEAGQHLPAERIALSNPTRIAARCARERAELLLDHPPELADPSHVPGTLAILSSLFAPLMIGERLLGVMTIQSPRRHVYAERERLMFRSLCAYGSIALDNAAAYRQLKETDAQRSLYAISDLVSSELGRSEMFQAVHGIVGRLMYAQNFFIVLYDRDRRSVQFPYFADALDLDVPDPELQLDEGQIADSLTLSVLRRGQPLMGSSSLLRERLGVSSNRGVGPDAADWLGVPMLAGNEVRGAVVVQSYDESIHYDDDDRALLSYVAQHILIALTRRQAQADLEQQVALRTSELAMANAQLGVTNHELQSEVEERKSGERLQAALFRIAELTSAANSMREFFESIHDVVGGLLNAKNFFIALLTDDGRALECPYAVDEHEPFRQRVLGRGLTEYALQARRPLRATRAQIDALIEAGEVQSVGSRCVCWLGVPLLQKEEVFGIIVVQSYSPEVLYTQQDQELLSFVALQVATALQRRRSQESLLRANTELEGRVEELRRAQDELQESETALNLALTEVKRNESSLMEAKAGLERGIAELEQTRRQVSLLAELSSFLQACPCVDDALTCIDEFGPRLFPGSSGTVYLADERGDNWINQRSWSSALTAGTAHAHSMAGSQCWALRRGQPYRVDGPAKGLCCPHASSIEPDHGYNCLPLSAQGRTFGMLHIEFPNSVTAAEADRRHALAVAMAEQTGLAIANIRLREALLEQSIRDPLTGLYNRRYMQESLHREVAQSFRSQAPLAILMIDVDHFKKFNDSFGHHAGDVVLRRVARAIQENFRQSDICCRFGGEEFTVLLPDTTLELAERLANKLLDEVRNLALSHENRALDRVTASVGVSLFPIHASSPEQLVEAADAALYQAKSTGRNKVTVSTG